MTAAYTTFFAPTSDATEVAASVQHGDKFADAIAAEADSPYAANSGVKITDVTLRSQDLATVTFDVTAGGLTVLPSVTGYAVREDESWKMAAETFCDLLQLQGDAPQACNDASLTALPGD